MSEVGPIETQTIQQGTEPRRGAVVLTFDGVNTAFLGPYGNTWLATPGWNQLATSSLLMEQCLTPNTQAEEAFRDLWGGTTGQKMLHSATTPGCSNPSAASCRARSRAQELHSVRDDRE